MKIIFDESWWEDDATLCIREKDTGVVYKMINCYPTDIKFPGLDYSANETVSQKT